MSRLIRIAIAVGLLGAASVSWWILRGSTSTGSSEQPEMPPVELASFTNSDCQKCHQATWDQWEASYHSKAFSSPEVQGAFRHFGHDRKCESCHAPVPVFTAGLETPVELRADDRDSGVNCLSCHALPDGSVAAVRTVADAPCRPLATPELSTSQACGGCHTAIFRDWSGSRYEQEGKTCQSCHMQSSDDDASRHTHLCIGGHSPEYIRSGVTMTVEQVEGQVRVEVTNHATGHNFPGERHNRVLLVQLTQRNAAGEITLIREEMIKNITPFRGESSAEQIQIDATFRADFPLTQSPVTADAKLLYKSFPWHSASDAIVLHEAHVDLAP